MSGLMDKIKDVAGNKEQQEGQPGDNVERSADNAVNNEVNQGASDVGVPQAADGMLDKMVDNKVNSDIPGGN